MDVSLQNFEKVTIDGNVAATILGTAAADTLIGDSGADAITGREGADTLTGGSRSDTFIFTTGDTVHWKPQIRLLILQQVQIKLILLP